VTRLVLVRHGEAVPSTGSDFARTLTPAGVAEVQRAGERLLALGWAPDLGWCSPAARALGTRDVLAALAPDAPWIVDPTFYRMGAHGLLAALGRLEADDLTVWAVGHDPHWTEAARRLTGEAVELVTGGAARLCRGPGGWKLLDVLGSG
jgi:phosphohistidine phosphatase SixA